MTHAATPRLPDFVVIGAMKAGTTSLFRWLDEHPGCDLPSVKEPHFFSLDAEFGRGVEAYRLLFESVAPGRLTGEASASYADPRISEVVARRMHETIPEARLVYLLRHPEDRLKSHYLHRWRRSRERRSLSVALEDPENPYVALSSYRDALEPFVRAFGREAILVVHLEDLAGPSSPGWRQVADFLGLEPRPGPAQRHNETRDKVAFTPRMLRWWEAGRLRGLKRLPAPVRRAARSVLGRPTGELRDLETEVRDVVVPEPVRSRLTRQWEGVHALVGAEAPPLVWTGETAR